MLACAPERGSSTPTFSAAPWARTIAGAASRDVEATMPALKVRRVRLVFGLRFIDFLPSRCGSWAAWYCSYASAQDAMPFARDTKSLAAFYPPPSHWVILLTMTTDVVN